MLLQFKVKNYRSIGGEAILDMTATTAREHSEFLLEKKGVNILPVASIFGANASGKSNLLKALFDFRNIVVSSHETRDKIPVTPFLFDSLINEPTEFELFVTLDEKEYNYGFSATKEKIVEEWLSERTFSKRDTVWREIFYRNESGFECKPKILQHLNQFNDLIEKNMLVLSFLGRKKSPGTEVFKNVFNWFLKMLYINSPDDLSQHEVYKQFVLSVYKENAEHLAKVKDLIREFDPNIEDIKIISGKNADGNDVFEAFTCHNGNEYTINIESDGTRKVFYMFLKIAFTLKYGGLLAIDELDCQLHPLLLRKIVRMFHDKDFNKNNAQLIFTSHNLIVLDNRELRRDEIWFMEKDEKGYTNLFSLSEFKTDSEHVRSDLDFGKHYLAGRFGAVPFEK